MANVLTEIEIWFGDVVVVVRELMSVKKWKN